MDLLGNQVPPAFPCMSCCPCFSFCSAQLPAGMGSPVVDYPPIWVHGRNKDRVLGTKPPFGLAMVPCKTACSTGSMVFSDNNKREYNERVAATV